MKKLNVLLPILMVFLANCSLDIAIDDVRADDFVNSAVLSTSRGVGDGVTSATVTMLLKNSDGTVIVGHVPDLQFVDNSGSAIGAEGITFFECSKSNSEGIATCIIKSIKVGERKVGFFNIIIELRSEVYFDPPERNGTFMQVVSSGQVRQDAEGYSVTSHTGAAFSGLRQVESGYTIFTSTTGSITPDN